MTEKEKKKNFDAAKGGGAPFEVPRLPANRERTEFRPVSPPEPDIKEILTDAVDDAAKEKKKIKFRPLDKNK